MLMTELTHPGVLELLAQCGHGDSIAIVDSNYPAQARRSRNVPIISLNITHNVPTTPMIVDLISQTIPLENYVLPLPPEEVSSRTPREVHEEIRGAVTLHNPLAKTATVAPADFYELTTAPALAFMIVAGERRHHGSVLLTVGYLPEL
jgi:L-fucose mutarotase